MIASFGISDVGPVRDNNEDALLRDDALALYVVSDGMGGHAAGEVASRLAVEAIHEFIRSSVKQDVTWPWGFDTALSVSANRLQTAIQLANMRIYRAAQEQADYHGMGTTVVGVLASGAMVTVGHVGDSRLYLLSKGRLIAQTRDDTWAATMLAGMENGAGVLAEHPMRNVLTNVLGTGELTEIHISELSLSDGEMLLLCTDGVHGVVDDETLRELMSQDAPVDAIARSLIATAVQRGTRDNVTVIVLRYEER
jgi:serine/threonine protein phosphatase PrpC